MPVTNPPPSLPSMHKATAPDNDGLTDAQIEFMDDLRASLVQMKNGDVMPALEAMHEIEREIELEENGSRPDA